MIYIGSSVWAEVSDSGDIKLTDLDGSNIICIGVDDLEKLKEYVELKRMERLSLTPAN